MLEFDAMVEFMNHVVAVLRVDGAAAARLFPPAARVLLNFADRIAVEVVSRALFCSLFFAQCFSLQGWRIHHTTSKSRSRCVERGIPQSNRCELRAVMADGGCYTRGWWAGCCFANQGRGRRVCLPSLVVASVILLLFRYRMFEPNMDEYLDEEIEFVKQAFDSICRAWDRKVSLI